MDTYPISSNSLEKYYHINGNQLSQQYKEHLSNYKDWEQKEHADEWMLFPDNIGPRLSIDETAISNGELYTIITNKDAHGRKGTIVAMVEGTKAEDVIKIVNKIPQKIRHQVMEITLDMANSMHVIAKKCFPNAEQVIDRFHVQKLSYDALQEIRIKHRWEAINEETNEMENAKLNGVRYKPKKYENGETKKEILFRSRLLLFKSPQAWTLKQKQRAYILFKLYPDMKTAAALAHRLKRYMPHQNRLAVQNSNWLYGITKLQMLDLMHSTLYRHPFTRTRIEF